MKLLFTYSVLLFTLVATAQKSPMNISNGFMAEGYDVVAYFDNMAIEGNETFTTTYEGAHYKFSSQSNLDTFLENPEKFVPAYGGFCAYAIADKGKKVGIDPKSFQIKDGNLYLFYDSLFADTKKKWNKKGADIMQQQADENWKNIVMKDQ
ncbi:MAG: YHS domain-containing protein [Flavobacteriales bacterium]|uniref:YHS domain-containing (seleno)protein n=1 Tax=Candidatus Ulvibacter alkanivorans TaxID=2267620 RepID=UPI000DF42543|nr:YHS domain-containing (seleno)protein [Candidatus Ulvibacter alkanivorans]MCH2490357.1 YHS domain-containing protein [Flavobacteriales bacterium]